LKMKVEGLREAQDRLVKAGGIATAKKERSGALGPATRIVADAWRDGAPVSTKGVKSGDNPHQPGGIRRAVLHGKVGRGARTGYVSVFATIDRKQAPQAGFIQGGTKRQKAKPSIFARPLRAVRETVRRVAMEGLRRLMGKVSGG